MALEKIKREEWAHFLNVGEPWSSTGTGVDFKRINKGFTEYTEQMNTEVVTEKYIGDKNASSSVESYAPVVGLSGPVFKDDDVWEALDTLHRTRARGADCEFEVLNIDIYNPTTSQTTVTYPAQLQPVVIALTSWGGSGNLAGEADMHYNGDPIDGTCTITSGVPTFTPAA